MEIARLKAQLDSGEKDKKLAVSEAVQEKEKEIAESREQIYVLTGRIETGEKESQLREKSLKESYEEKLKMKDEQIAYYRDFKARMVHEDDRGKSGAALRNGIQPPAGHGISERVL